MSLSAEHAPRLISICDDAEPDSLEAILAHTPFLLTRCSADLRYIFVSEACAQLFGLPPAEIAGKPIIEIIGEQAFNTIKPYVQKVLEGHRVEYVTDIEYRNAGRRRMHVIYVPERDRAGDVCGWIASISDITRETTAEQRIEADLRAIQCLQDVAAACSAATSDLDEVLHAVVTAAIAIAGADKGNLQTLDEQTRTLKIAAQRGFAQEFLEFFEDVNEQAVAACAAALECGDQVIVGDVLRSPIFDGQASQAVLLNADVRSVISTPLKSSQRRVLGMLSVHFREPQSPSERILRFIGLLARYVADFLERREADHLKHTLLHELEHRTNNLLAVVQSFAHYSLLGDGPIAQKRDRLEARLQALARSNREIVRWNVAQVELAHVINTELGGYGDRVMLDGASITLSARSGQKIALALHELATNAIKYGSLSNNTGWVRLIWKCEHQLSTGRILHLHWQEYGGPEVTEPVRFGFGTDLIKTSFKNVRFEYPTEGIICRISLHLTDL